MKIKKMATCSLIIALALICSKIKIFSLPMGGSITLFSMLIISLPGFFYGLKYGFISAFIYSLLKLLLGGYIYSPAQAIVDYILSYTSFFVTAFAFNSQKKSKFIFFYLISVTLRFVFACISGMIFFIDYAPSTMHPLVYNIIYNSTYIYTEAIISIVLIIVMPKKLQNILHN